MSAGGYGGSPPRAKATGRSAGAKSPRNVHVSRSGPVTTVILDRPEVRNAVDAPTAAALAEAFADFDADAFGHVALWDARDEWIEMRLRSSVAQQVRLPAIGLTVGFAAGEEMRTEVSAKFRPEGVRAELAAAGFASRAAWTDRAGRFLVTLAEAV